MFIVCVENRSLVKRRLTTVRLHNRHQQAALTAADSTSRALIVAMSHEDETIAQLTESLNKEKEKSKNNLTKLMAAVKERKDLEKAKADLEVQVQELKAGTASSSGGLSFEAHERAVADAVARAVETVKVGLPAHMRKPLPVQAAKAEAATAQQELAEAQVEWQAALQVEAAKAGQPTPCSSPRSWRPPRRLRRTRKRMQRLH